METVEKMSVENIRIRPIERKDLRVIVPLLHERNSALSLDVLTERVDEMATQGFQCIGAYDQTRLVGIAGFWIKTRYHTGKVIEPDSVFVTEELRSKQIGEKMMQWIYDFGKTQGCLSSELHCYVTNWGAHRFWLNQGYQIIAFHFAKEFK